MRRMSAILPPCWSTSSGSIPGQLDSHWIPLCRLVWRDVTNLFDERQTRYVVKLLMWLGCVTPKVGSASTFLPQSAALFLRTPVWHAPLQPNWNSLNKMNWKTIIINHNNYGTIISIVVQLVGQQCLLWFHHFTKYRFPPQVWTH